MTTSNFESLKNIFYEINALRAATHMMEWDLQVLMPREGANARAEHLGILTRLAHEKLIDPELRALLDKSHEEVPPELEEAALLRVIKREIELATKIPTSLVEEKSKLAAKAYEIWVEAKAESDFPKFYPYLKRMFEICTEEAEHLGYKGHPYDALLDQYEEGSTTAECREVFNTIKTPLVNLVQEIVEKKQLINESKLTGQWDESRVKPLLLDLLKNIGFDLNRGRLDKSAHPFCTHWSVKDVRLTTTYPSYLPSPFMTLLHEAGHGMYEQGSPEKWDRTPLAGGISLGVHESQSRLWENIIGRSREFWAWYLPKVKSAFPEISDVTLDEWYRAINKVQPSFIRVEADELTYNLHVLVRFEIETDVIAGKLQTKDIPEVWNNKMKDYLGITPTKDAEGCLQDVHWSAGLIGYFPTYTLGNILSYQIWRCLQKDLSNTSELIEKGQFAPILHWLQEKVYSQGKRYTPKDLILKVTGRKLEAKDYLEGLTAKYQDLYSLEKATRVSSL